MDMNWIVVDRLNFPVMNDTPFFADSWLTTGFVVALLVGLVLKFWLALRQIRHVTQHRACVPTAFAHTITSEAHHKAADYTLAKVRLSLGETVLGTVTLLGWTLLGGLSVLNTWLMQCVGAGMVQQLALLGCFVLISGVIDLPLSLYRTFVLEARFGFNTATLWLWLADLLKSSLVGACIGLPIAALILWVMGAIGSAWWLWAWGTWMGVNLLLLVIYPVWIAPMFNTFTPVEEGTLKTRVTALMQRCGFSAKGLFVMDGSKRSAHANAYFTGWGSAKRVVFFDTLLSKLSTPEVEAVLAHELGHFKHRHIIQRIALMFAMSLAGFALLGWLVGQTWFYTGLGVHVVMDTPHDAVALLLFMLTLPVVSFFMVPLFAKVLRRHEFEADTYAVQHTSGYDLATALLKLYEDNASTMTPDPVYVAFYDSHPSASERLSRLVGSHPITEPKIGL